MAESASAEFRIGGSDGKHLQFKNQCSIGTNPPGRFPLLTKSEIRRHKNLPFGADFHARQSVLPALHSSAAPDQIMAVTDELTAVNKSTAHLNIDHVIGRGDPPGAFLKN